MPWISQEEYDAAIKLLNDKESHNRVVREQLDQIKKINKSNIDHAQELETKYKERRSELQEMIKQTEELQKMIHEDNISTIKAYGRYNNTKTIVTVSSFLLLASTFLFFILSKFGLIETSLTKLIITCIELPTIILLLSDISFRNCIKRK